MSNSTKNVALTVAGVASVFAAGQTVATAATYTVQNGDNLSTIAEKFNLTVDELVSENKLTDSNMIFTDQKLEVSKTASVDTAAIKASTEADAQVAAQKASEAAQKDAQQQAAEAAAQKASEKAETETVATATEDDKSNDESEEKVSDAQATPEVTQVKAEKTEVVPASAGAASGSTRDQFLANGGTAAMWDVIVMPESEGNPNAVSPNGYQGLGQTKESWGTGSVADQTKGMVNYATSRYGSIDGALAFRQSNGWW